MKNFWLRFWRLLPGFLLFLFTLEIGLAMPAAGAWLGIFSGWKGALIQEVWPYEAIGGFVALTSAFLYFCLLGGGPPGGAMSVTALQLQRLWRHSRTSRGALAAIAVGSVMLLHLTMADTQQLREISLLGLTLALAAAVICALLMKPELRAMHIERDGGRRVRY